MNDYLVLMSKHTHGGAHACNPTLPPERSPTHALKKISNLSLAAMHSCCPCAAPVLPLYCLCFCLATPTKCAASMLSRHTTPILSYHNILPQCLHTVSPICHTHTHTTQHTLGIHFATPFPILYCHPVFRFPPLPSASLRFPPLPSASLQDGDDAGPPGSSEPLITEANKELYNVLLRPGPDVSRTGGRCVSNTFPTLHVSFASRLRAGRLVVPVSLSRLVYLSISRPA